MVTSHKPAVATQEGWDPMQYLCFGDERLRPALDMMARVKLTAPRRIVDLGCGPGNVTAILKQRFPGAAVTGLDSSAAMLEKARLAAPDCHFVQGDFLTWGPEEPPDLIYSNAALHWVDQHATLFPRLLSLLAPSGVLAVQMPAMHKAPLRTLPYFMGPKGPWAKHLRGVASAPDILEPGEYWDILRPRAATLDLWETVYMHALQGENAVGEWATGSSLRPFLDALPADLRAPFRTAYDAEANREYPRRPDGITLLPFRRIFIVAQAPP
ncbi:MAG: methyltransferase domain-containing protein [Acetobacteraceae bacterium]|nr:methyltransferase domain-containing protein [Acetobacteraceae bacterium]